MTPIRIKVDPSHDASKVKAEGPGLSRSGKTTSVRETTFRLHFFLQRKKTHHKQPNKRHVFIATDSIVEMNRIQRTVWARFPFRC